MFNCSFNCSSNIPLSRSWIARANWPWSSASKRAISSVCFCCNSSFRSCKNWIWKRCLSTIDSLSASYQLSRLSAFFESLCLLDFQFIRAATIFHLFNCRTRTMRWWCVSWWLSRCGTWVHGLLLTSWWWLPAIAGGRQNHIDRLDCNSSCSDNSTNDRNVFSYSLNHDGMRQFAIYFSFLPPAYRCTFVMQRILICRFHVTWVKLFNASTLVIPFWVISATSASVGNFLFISDTGICGVAWTLPWGKSMVSVGMCESNCGKYTSLAYAYSVMIVISW